jgi:hypothetical protein
VKKAPDHAAAPKLGENGTTHEILDLLKKRFE